MWSYYGSKSKIVHLYPAPIYPKIIEPFAGTARYSLRYYDKDVLLVDKYQIIIDAWRWLQKTTKEYILNIPDVNKGDDIRIMDLDDGAKIIVGFCINGGSTEPKNIGQDNIINTFNVWNSSRAKIANQLFKIKHWKFQVSDYKKISNQEATWFIDPPYQFGGEAYKMPNSDINFEELADWCKSRKGQVIVCENSKANWMPFRPLAKMKGQAHKTQEVIWSNLPTVYDHEQLSIFDLTKE